jgi:LytS/YehU family sensor histidine kinase
MNPTQPAAYPEADANAHAQALARARRDVKDLRSFYFSFAAYVPVCTGLWVLNAATLGPGEEIWWAIYPTAGWGLSLVAWGAFRWGRAHWDFFGPEWEERKVQALMARSNIRRLSTEKALVTAQLRTLQAQIEPHFLFNTLANVQSLIRRQPEVAQSMLDQFITYLRQSLSASRAQTGTLGQEVELLRNYLGILQIRMGARLRFELDVPADLSGTPLAPMLLQPLVENAVQHGLEPKLEGGQVRVQARAQSRAGRAGLSVVVADDGLGVGAGAAPRTRDGAGGGTGKGAVGGVGLSNLRERLALLYDGQAQIDLVDAQPGTEVRLWLPIPHPEAVGS